MKFKNWLKNSTIICFILGTLLHFFFDWSGQNNIVGLFSAVNESTWEHLKLAFYPMFLMAFLGLFFIKNKPDNYWFAHLIGILTAIAFITVFFYTYTGILGKNISSLDIGLYYIGVWIGEFVTYLIMKSDKFKELEKFSIALLILIMFSFIIYTFYPPKIGYFKDPLDGSYGIKIKKFKS